MDKMKLTNFIQKGKFYKANLHAHSTNSDGKLSQEEAVSLYKDNGYNFLALSEHNRITQTDKYDTKDFKLVPAVELHSYINNPLTIHHFVGLTTMDNKKVHDGMRLEDIPFTNNRESVLALEKRLTDLDFLTFYCHPTWSRVELNQFDFISSNMMEIYNWGTIFSQAHNKDVTYWEDWNRLGKPIWGLANDDGHRIEQHLGGWNMIKCEEFTIESMLESLKAGSFYATTGPEIHDFYVEDDIVHVKCSPASMVSIITMSKWGKCYRDPSASITEIEHEISSSAYLIRIEVHDREGNIAWSNPIIRPENLKYR